EISAVMFQDNVQPDANDWKVFPYKMGSYALRAKPKNKELRKEFDDLKRMAIHRSELDAIVGHNNFMHLLGFEFDINGYHLISSGEDLSSVIPADCERISDIEYEALLKQPACKP
ncbi:MAG: hypothetical protein RR346_12140, partial [Bacteroidales bacterium]